MLELDEMNNPADISTPDELERALRAYLRAESPVDRRLKCPESLLYIEPVKTLLRMNPRGHRPWFSYDRDQGVLKLLAMSRPLHDAATMLASTFMTSAAVARFIPSQFERKITLSTKGYLMARTCEPQAGSSKVQAWTKYPDLSIVFRADDQPLPVVIFETGFTERYADLANDAAQWLLRSGGKVRLVVLIDIREDSNSRLLLKKDPAARGRLRHLVRSFGSDFARAKHDIHDPSDDASDTSDPEIYDSIRASIVVSDWVGEISAEMELWELRDGVPVIRERTAVLPRPELPQNPGIRISDLIPPEYWDRVEAFDPRVVHEIDLDFYREILQDSLREHAFHRAVTVLREKPKSADPMYIPDQK